MDAWLAREVADAFGAALSRTVAALYAELDIAVPEASEGAVGAAASPVQIRIFHDCVSITAFP